MQRRMSTKCRICKCNAQCCYNIPFDRGELDRFKEKIVNKVLFILPMHGAQVAFTDEDPGRNKCPFLRADYKCNIYENRPDVCRKFGVIPELPCKWIKR